VKPSPLPRTIRNRMSDALNKIRTTPLERIYHQQQHKARQRTKTVSDSDTSSQSSSEKDNSSTETITSQPKKRLYGNNKIKSIIYI
jgi:hypothetical protein